MEEFIYKDSEDVDKRDVTWGEVPGGGLSPLFIPVKVRSDCLALLVFSPFCFSCTKKSMK